MRSESHRMGGAEAQAPTFRKACKALRCLEGDALLRRLALLGKEQTVPCNRIVTFASALLAKKTAPLSATGCLLQLSLDG